MCKSFFICIILLQFAWSITPQQFEVLVRVGCEPFLYSASKSTNDSAIAMTVTTKDVVIDMFAGTSAPDGTKLKTSDMFLWGSLTKMVTAAAIMKQYQRGKIDIDVPVYRYLDPWLMRTNGSRLSDIYSPADLVNNITARDLIGMTSGIGDFDTPETEQYQFSNKSHDITPYEDIWLAPHELTCTDKCGNYSSTNFDVAGLLLAAINDVDEWYDYNQYEVFPDDATYVDEIFYPKLGTCSSFVTENRTIIHGYVNDTATGEIIDSYDMSCLGGWTCGNTVASNRAMGQFTYDLFGKEGTLLDDKYVNMMISGWKKTDPKWFGSTYGLGVMLMTRPHLTHLSGFPHTGEETDPFDDFQYGHGGETYGFVGAAVYNPSQDIAYTVSNNNDLTLAGPHGPIPYQVLGECVMVVAKILNGTSIEY